MMASPRFCPEHRTGLVELAHLDPQEKGVLAKSVEANVRWSVKNMLRLQHKRRRDGDLAVVGAVYELKSGRVRFLDQPPDNTNGRSWESWQAEQRPNDVTNWAT